jgi:hypothetical protein
MALSLRLRMTPSKASKLTPAAASLGSPVLTFLKGPGWD